MTEPTFFNLMASIVDKKFFPTEDQIETMNSFVTCQFLANDPMGALVANTMNVYNKVPMTAQYRFFRNALPSNIKRITYIKKPKTNVTEDLENIMNYYNVNEKIAIEYFEIMTKEALAELKDYYSYGKVK